MATGLVGVCGPSMSSAWQQHATAQRRMEVGAVTRYLFLAMQNMRVERGTVSAALLENEPVDAATGRIFRTFGQGLGRLWPEALDMLGRLDFNDRDRWVAELRSKSAAVETMRADADGFLPPARSRRQRGIQ